MRLRDFNLKFSTARRILSIGAMACAATFGQSAGPAEGPAKDETIQTLLKKIDDLEAAQKKMQEKIDTLTGSASNSSVAISQSSSAGPAAPVAAAPVAAAPVPPDPSENIAADVSEHAHALGPVEFQGFSDFNYGRAWFEKLPAGGLAGTPESFEIGDLDLFTNTRISDHWSVLGELLITSDFSNEFSAEIDRLLFSYKQNDYFKISFGKFDTALGYFTNAFHRAQYFQTGIGRPIMYSDEDNGGILPVHSIGATATGLIPSGALGLHWVAEVANGRNVDPNSVPVQNFVDYKTGKAMNLALYIRPEWLHGLQAGFSSYRDTLYPLGFGGVKQMIFAGHIAYMGRKLEWLNEAAVVRHQLQSTGQEYHSVTSYTELGWLFGKTRPYFRYDYQNIPVADPVFGELGRHNGPSIGVNRHLSNYVLLKLQYGRLAERSTPTANDFNAQLAFAF